MMMTAMIRSAGVMMTAVIRTAGVMMTAVVRTAGVMMTAVIRTAGVMMTAVIRTAGVMMTAVIRTAGVQCDSLMLGKEVGGDDGVGWGGGREHMGPPQLISFERLRVTLAQRPKVLTHKGFKRTLIY